LIHAAIETNDSTVISTTVYCLLLLLLTM